MIRPHLVLAGSRWRHFQRIFYIVAIERIGSDTRKIEIVGTIASLNDVIVG